MTDMVAARARLLRIVVETIQQECPTWNPSEGAKISELILQMLSEEDAKHLALLSDERIASLARELMPTHLPGLYV